MTKTFVSLLFIVFYSLRGKRRNQDEKNAYIKINREYSMNISTLKKYEGKGLHYVGEMLTPRIFPLVIDFEYNDFFIIGGFSELASNSVPYMAAYPNQDAEFFSIGKPISQMLKSEPNVALHNSWFNAEKNKIVLSHYSLIETFDLANFSFNRLDLQYPSQNNGDLFNIEKVVQTDAQKAMILYTTKNDSAFYCQIVDFSSMNFKNISFPFKLQNANSYLKYDILKMNNNKILLYYYNNLYSGYSGDISFYEFDTKKEKFDKEFKIKNIGNSIYVTKIDDDKILITGGIRELYSNIITSPTTVLYSVSEQKIIKYYNQNDLPSIINKDSYFAFSAYENVLFPTITLPNKDILFTDIDEGKIKYKYVYETSEIIPFEIDLKISYPTMKVLNNEQILLIGGIDKQTCEILTQISIVNIKE